MSKVWFITGANRGLGFEIAQAALKTGDKVVATGRDVAKTIAAFGGESDSLIVAKLDVTNRAGIQAAVREGRHALRLYRCARQ
jgi:NAD(P)-dependent dehydrogenase (short-subunit alcohol dehydrogenase family)